MKIRFISNDPTALINHKIGKAGFDLDSVLAESTLGQVRKILKKFSREDKRGLLNHLPGRHVYRSLLNPQNHTEASVAAILRQLGMYKNSFDEAENSFEFKPQIDEVDLRLSNIYSLKVYFDLKALAGNMGNHHYVKKGNFYERSVIENGYTYFWEEWVRKHNSNRSVIDSIIKEIFKIKFATQAGFKLPEALEDVCKEYLPIINKLDMNQADVSSLILDKIEVKSFKNGEFITKDMFHETYVYFDFALLKKYKSGAIFDKVSSAIDTLNEIIKGSKNDVTYLNKQEAILFSGQIESKYGINVDDLTQLYINRKVHINFPIENNAKVIEYNPTIFTQLREDALIYNVEHIQIDNYLRIPTLLKKAAVEVMDLLISNHNGSKHQNIELSEILEHYKIIYIDHEKSLCLLDPKDILDTDIRTGWKNHPVPVCEGKNKFYKKLADNDISRAVTDDIEILKDATFTESIRKNRPTREVPQFTLTPMEEYQNDKKNFNKNHLFNILGVSQEGRRLFYEKYQIEYKDFVIVKMIEDAGGPEKVTGILSNQAYIDTYNSMVDGENYKKAKTFSFDDFMLIFYKIKTNRRVYSTFNDSFNNVYVRILNSANSALNKFKSKEFIQSRSENGIAVDTLVDMEIAGYTFKIKNISSLDYVQHQVRQILEKLQLELCKCVMSEFGVTAAIFRQYAIELSEIKINLDDNLKSMFDLYSKELGKEKKEISLVEAEKLLSSELDLDADAAKIAKLLPLEVKNELRRRSTDLMKQTKFKQFSDGLLSGMSLMNSMIGSTGLEFGIQSNVIHQLLNMNK